MNDWKEKIAFKGDKILWYIVIMLMIASVMVVYSSTGRLAYNEKAGNTFLSDQAIIFDRRLFWSDVYRTVDSLPVFL